MSTERERDGERVRVRVARLALAAALMLARVRLSVRLSVSQRMCFELLRCKFKKDNAPSRASGYWQQPLDVGLEKWQNKRIL